METAMLRSLSGIHAAISVLAAGNITPSAAPINARVTTKAVKSHFSNVNGDNSVKIAQAAVPTISVFLPPIFCANTPPA